MRKKHGGSQGHKGRGRIRGKSRGRGGNRTASRRRDNDYNDYEDDNFKMINGLKVYTANTSNHDNLKNSFQSTKLNKRLKKTKLHQLNEMVDANQGDFTNIEEMSVNQMMLDGFGSNKRKLKGNNNMYNEVGYTQKNRSNMFKKILRKMPIEFVKSEEVYDPSKDLYAKWAIKREEKLDNSITDETIINLSEVGSEDEVMDSNYDDDDDDDDELESESDNQEDDDELELEDISNDHGDEICEASFENEIKSNPVKEKKAKQEILIFDDNEDDIINISFEESDDTDTEEHEQENIDEADYDSEMDDDIEDVLQVTEEQYKSRKLDSINEIQIGKFLGSMKETNDGDYFIELPVSKGGKNNLSSGIKEELLYSADGDSLSINEVINKVTKKIPEKNIKEAVKEDDALLLDPEFGELEEDLVSDEIKNIMFENVRVGMTPNSHQYYVCAPELVELMDYSWVDIDYLKSLLLGYGLPEHRFDAFLKLNTKHLLNPDVTDEEMEFNEDEFYADDYESSDDDITDYESNEKEKKLDHVKIYDSDEDQNSADDYNELLEGIDDLLTMHQNSAKNSTYDPIDVATQTIKSKGRGKKLKIEVNTLVSDDIIKHLEEKMRLKKDRNRLMKTHLSNEFYILKDYPYFMEMSDIVYELEKFTLDDKREKLIFPIFDYHVIMVMKSMVKVMGYKLKKEGSKKKERLVVRKPKNGHVSLGTWKKVKDISLKRSICFRMDVSIKREEKRAIKLLCSESLHDLTADEIKQKLRDKGAELEQWNTELRIKMGTKGKNKNEFSYKEGEIVGADAKEISEDSIGRKLLEKMGWKTGDALGPSHNKGIIEPIRAVVKKSKAGIQ